MKGKAAVAGTLLVIVSSALVWAGNPWKEKPAAVWTKKEVEKVLNKSPWVRPLVYPAAIPTRSPSSSVPLMNAQAEYNRQLTVRAQQIQGVQSPGRRIPTAVCAGCHRRSSSRLWCAPGN